MYHCFPPLDTILVRSTLKKFYYLTWFFSGLKRLLQSYSTGTIYYLVGSCVCKLQEWWGIYFVKYVLSYCILPWDFYMMRLMANHFCLNFSMENTAEQTKCLHIIRHLWNWFPFLGSKNNTIVHACLWTRRLKK